MHQYLHINVIDTRAPSSALAAARREAMRGPTENISVDNQWSMDRICRRVVQRITQSRYQALGVLRFICHGNAGYVELGNGLTTQSARNFRLLRGHFGGGFPKIEVHACGVLSGTAISVASPVGTIDLNAPGHTIMRELAHAAQVLVIAAYNYQYADGRMAFEGPIRHFRPPSSP